MSAYYKAVRPDGRDFYSGAIDYAAALASGEVLRHPGASIDGGPPEHRQWNRPETYFSVSVEPADCTGFSWPCRLFRVEPVGPVLGKGKRKLRASPNKRACSALRVVEELPAWQALGPNGEAVAALIERCSTLTAEGISRLGAARGAARDATWDAARGAARDAARGAARALLVRDLISPKQFATLTGPWREAIGETWA